MPNIFIEYKRIIDEWLQAYLSEHENSLKIVNNWGSDVSVRLRSFTANGKSIRGSLVFFALEAYGKQIDDDAKKIAGAIELLQSGLLIHDDIIDQDRMRRGSETIFAQYENVAQKLPIINKTSFGSGMAICAGDMTFFLALEILSSLTDAEMSRTLISIITKEYANICLAQMQDITFGYSKNVPSEADVIHLYTYKTARYTFSLPLILGGTLAHAPISEISKLETFGEKIGIAFQMNDDLLNVFGSQEQTGKSVGSDMREGKKTLAYLYLRNSATEEEKKELDMLLGTSLTEKQQAYILGLLETYKIRDTARTKMNTLVKDAERILDTLQIQPSFLQDLHAIIKYSVARTK